MIIKKIKIKYNQEYKEITFDNNNIITSTENSVGKTTLARIIPHAMGFKNQPLTDKIKKTKLETEILINTKGRDVTIYRRNKWIKVSINNEEKTKKYLFPNDYDDFIQDVYQIDSFIFELLSFGFLIDQDNGWKVINRGKINNNSIYFSLDKHIPILGVTKDKWTDIQNIINENRIINKRVHSLTSLSKSYSLNKQFIRVNRNTDSVNSASLNLLKQNRNKILTKLKYFNDELDKNNRAKKLILDLKLKVQINNNIFELNNDNVITTKFNEYWVKSEKNNLQTKLSQIDLKIEELESMNEGQMTLFEDSPQEKADFQADLESVNTLLIKLDSKLKNNNQLIDSLTGTNKAIINDFLDLIQDTSIKLKIDHMKTLTKHKWVDLSGARRMIQVLNIRVAFNKLVEKHMGFKIPMIIDSPAANEFVDKSKALINNIINKIDTQVLVFTIRDSGITLTNAKHIPIDKKLLEGGLI